MSLWDKKYGLIFWPVFVTLFIPIFFIVWEVELSLHHVSPTVTYLTSAAIVLGGSLVGGLVYGNALRSTSDTYSQAHPYRFLVKIMWLRRGARISQTLAVLTVVAYYTLNHIGEFTLTAAVLSLFVMVLETFLLPTILWTPPAKLMTLASLRSEADPERMNAPSKLDGFTADLNRLLHKAHLQYRIKGKASFSLLYIDSPGLKDDEVSRMIRLVERGDYRGVIDEFVLLSRHEPDRLLELDNLSDDLRDNMPLILGVVAIFIGIVAFVLEIISLLPAVH